jgi:hypothetical protein
MNQRLNQTQFRGFPSLLPRPRFMLICGCLLVLACIKTPLGFSQSNQTPTLLNPQPKSTSIISPEANRPPDKNQQMEMREQQLKKKNFDAANAERKRQINDDSALLLKLANELKVEMAKTPEDMLSVSELRKIEDIERLAHNVQQKMKLTVGAN